MLDSVPIPDSIMAPALHLSPTYLRAAIAEIDACFDALANPTNAQLRYENDTGENEPLAA